MTRLTILAVALLFALAIRAGAPSSIQTQTARITAPVTLTRATVGAEHMVIGVIVTTGAIVITAATICTD
jgi:hypothetical protein